MQASRGSASHRVLQGRFVELPSAEGDAVDKITDAACSDVPRSFIAKQRNFGPGSIRLVPLTTIFFRDLVEVGLSRGGFQFLNQLVLECPSSDDLRQIAGFRKGGSGLSVIEIMRHAVDAASDGLRLSGV